MLEDGIIRPSQSPWSSPTWIVPKKPDASGQQKWRIVIDYRKVNEKTIDDRYPLPNINDILDKLGRCNYFTTLDLASGFHQIELQPDSIPKTAFNVENGHYEFVRMPFRLKNAPATFQRVMDNVLKDLQNKICLVYMDDIIVFSTSLQEHVSSLRRVFTNLRNAGLKIQLDKSEFLCKSVEFIGHVVTPEGVKPNPKEIEAIKRFPIPKTAKEIKSFLGLVEDPISQYPDFSKTFNITTDASNFAIGAVLSQGPIGKDLPVAYASRTLNPAECNYSIIEKELLAIVWTIKYFGPYVYGTKFNIITDHKPLQWLFSLKEPSSKLDRWRLKLEEYDYNIIYKKGKANTNADAFSRVEIHPIDFTDSNSMIVNLDDKELPNLDADELCPSQGYAIPSKHIPRETPQIKLVNPKNHNQTMTRVHSATEYTPFQIGKGQLDFKNPFETTKNEQISNYIAEHTQTLELLSGHLSEKLRNKERQSLERENRHRKRSIALNPDQPAFAKNNSKTQIDQLPFAKLNDPKVIEGVKILANDKVIHQRQLKPQRILTVTGHQQGDEDHSDSDDIPLSRLRNKN
ncbi:hypothetical protein Trydic_g11176 [Trypoxylus dichotomus]